MWTAARESQEFVYPWLLQRPSGEARPGALRGRSDDPKQKQTCEDLERLLECVKAALELEKYFKTKNNPFPSFQYDGKSS